MPPRDVVGSDRLALRGCVGHFAMECSSLTAFVESLAAHRPLLCDLYGIRLRSSGGSCAAYVGRTEEGERPVSYLPALTAPVAGGGPTHLEWRGVPGRLKVLWQRGFYSGAEPLRFLRSVPRSTETAAARALEDVLGVDCALGGLLALDQRGDGVRDACLLMRMHDHGVCVRCGRAGHFADSCEPSVLQDDELPLAAQRTKRKLAALEQALAQPVPALAPSLAQAQAQAPVPAPAPLLAAPPAAAFGAVPAVGLAGAPLPAAAPGPRPHAQEVHAPRTRLQPLGERPTTWRQLQLGLTFFDAGGGRVCIVNEFLAALHMDRRHAVQSLARWRAVSAPPLAHVADAAHVWQPAVCRGVRGSPPWLMSEDAAKAVFAWQRR